MKSYLKILLKSMFRRKPLVYVCIPILICFLITLVINFLYYEIATERILNEFSSRLNYATLQLDEIYNNTVSLLNFLAEDSNINQLLRNRSKNYSASEYRDLSMAASKTLGVFQNIDSVNDDVSIYLRKYQNVITKYGVHSAGSYFNLSYKYSGYPKSFWDSFKSHPFRYKLLSLTSVSIGETMRTQSDSPSTGTTKSIMPFVWQDIEGPPEGGLIIANIDLRKIAERLHKSYIFENTNIFISDTQGNVYTVRDADSETAGEIFAANLTTDTLHQRVIAGKNYFIYSKQSGFAPFSSLTYTIYTDSSLVLGSLNKFNRSMGVVMFATFLLTVIVMLFMFNKMYSPLNMFLSQVDSYIKLLDVHEDDNHFSSLGSLAQNYFFTHLLSWENYYSKGMLENLLKDLKINFVYEKFIIVMINYLLTTVYYETFGKDGQKIISRLNTIMTAILPDNAVAYPVLLSSNQLCIIINSNNTITPSSLKETYKNFLQSISHDHEYVNIQVAISLEKDKLEDIHQAYLESRNAMLLLTPFQHNAVVIYGEYSEFQLYELSSRIEEALFTALSTRNSEKCIEILDSIFEDNKAAAQPTFRALCLRIYSIFSEVVYNRGATPQEIMGQSYMNINILVYELPPETVWGYINDFCRVLTDNTVNSKKYRIVKIDDVLEYIDQNYHNNNLSLLSIADYFNVTDKYISKFIVDKSGTNFHTYLIRRRIEEAKRLLCESDIKVNDLLVKVGFSNRNTFQRAFRKITGLSPSEYRASFLSKKT